jgi:hypothetical protein
MVGKEFNRRNGEGKRDLRGLRHLVIPTVYACFWSFKAPFGMTFTVYAHQCVPHRHCRTRKLNATGLEDFALWYI